MCFSSCRRVQRQPFSQALPPCSGTGPEQHRANAARPGGEAPGSCNTLQCSREVGIIPLLRDSLSNKTSVEPLLGCCVRSMGGIWMGGLHVEMLSSSASSHLGRKGEIGRSHHRYGKSTLLCTYNSSHTPQGKDQNLLFYISIQSNYKKHKALLGPRLSTGEAQG